MHYLDKLHRPSSGAIEWVRIQSATPTAVGQNSTGVDSVTEDLFPGPERDPILQLFLSLPWTQLGPSSEAVKPGLEFYARVIELPEYHHQPLRKHLPAEYAFFHHERLSTLDLNTEITFRAAPSVALIGRYDEAPPVFPHLTALVRQKRRVAFEVDGRRPSGSNDRFLPGSPTGTPTRSSFECRSCRGRMPREARDGGGQG
jgi:hypothetical protein